MAESSSKSKAKNEKPKLSSYGDPAERQYSRFYSLTILMLLYVMYISSNLLPLLMLLFGAGVYLGWIPKVVLMCIATAVAIDFAIPLQNGYRPDQDQKKRMDRVFTEGMQHYFPGRSIFLPDNLSKEKSYILATWPHGLMSGGTHVGFADFDERGFFPIYGGASALRYVPFVRRLLHSLGFCDVSKAGLSRVLDVKKYGPTYPFNIVHLVVGGINEMFYSPNSNDRNVEQIILNKRKGFIKIALTSGCDIIPFYNFGANQVYGRVFGPKSFLCKLSSTLQISLVIWLGRFNIPMFFLPKQVPLMGVIGPVFEVPKVPVDQITNELVQKTHADFGKALKALFDEYKVVYVEEMGADKEWLTKELIFEDE